MFPLKIFVIGGCFALGVVLADLTHPGELAALGVGVGGFVCLAAAWIRQRSVADPQSGDLLPPLGTISAALMMVGVFGTGFCDLGARAAELSHSALAALDGQVAAIEGLMVTDPQPAGRGTGFTLGSLTHDHRPVSGKLQVRFFGPGPKLELGDRVRLEALIVALDRSDPYQAALARRGIVARTNLLGNELEVFRRASNPVLRASNYLRSRMDAAATSSLARDQAGVALGLVIGDERRTSDEVKEDFRASGLAHLTAVSGANVAMVLAALLLLVRALRFPRRAQIVSGLVVIVIFAVITRWEPSVLRATVMASIALAAFFFGRLSKPSQALGVAFLGLLAFDPMLLWSIGFQLSFAATAGIIWLRPVILARLERLPGVLAEPIAIGVAAQLAVFPLIALHFGRISLLSIPANLAAFPLVAPATVLGLMGGAMAMVSIPAGEILMEVAGVFVSGLIWIARVFGRGAYAQLNVPDFNSAEILVTYLVLAAVLMLLSRRGRWARWPASIALLTLIAANLVPAAPFGTPEALRVTFFDVGEGDAALVESPSGARILIDGGRDPHQVARALRRRGFKRLDLVAASHLHADHVLGLVEVLRRFDVGLAVHPGLKAPLLQTLEAVGELEQASDREAVQLGDMTVDFLGPSPDMRIAAESPDSAGLQTEGSVLNDSSLVMRVQWGNDCLLFTGDLEEAGQEELLNAHRDRVACTIMKAPHHGSARLVASFVDSVDPEWVAVSVGPNDYGHPTRKALSTFERAGAKVLRTDRLDDIVLEMDRQGVVRIAE